MPKGDRVRSLLARPPEQLGALAGTLADAFYLLAFVALLAALTGAPGLALLFLCAAGGLHVARVALEESVRRGERPAGAERRGRAARRAASADSGEPELKVYDARARRDRAAASPPRARSRSTAGTRR